MKGDRVPILATDYDPPWIHSVTKIEWNQLEKERVERCQKEEERRALEVETQHAPSVRAGSQVYLLLPWRESGLWVALDVGKQQN